MIYPDISVVILDYFEWENDSIRDLVSLVDFRRCDKSNVIFGRIVSFQ